MNRKFKDAYFEMLFSEAIADDTFVADFEGLYLAGGEL